MSGPLVSIITPCYNGEAFLNRYFESILSQTYSNLELIFINDGSTDRTEEIALTYREPLEKKGIRYIYEYQKNAGQAAALNRGLKLFTGDYLTWPDSDDVMTPDCIEKKVGFLRNNPQVEMVRSNGVYINEETGERRRISCACHKVYEDILEDLLLVHTYGCSGCYMISKSLLLMCYPDRNIYESRTGQNWQLLVPAASYTLCGYIDDDLYLVFEHGDSHSRKKRTIAEMYERWNSFTEILIHALEHCKSNQCILNNMVRENCARQIFYYAVDERNKAVMRACLKAMNRYGKVTLKEYCLYLKKIFE